MMKCNLTLDGNGRLVVQFGRMARTKLIDHVHGIKISFMQKWVVDHSVVKGEEESIHITKKFDRLKNALNYVTATKEMGEMFGMMKTGKESPFNEGEWIFHPEFKAPPAPFMTLRPEKPMAFTWMYDRENSANSPYVEVYEKKLRGDPTETYEVYVNGKFQNSQSNLVDALIQAINERNKILVQIEEEKTKKAVELNVYRFHWTNERKELPLSQLQPGQCFGWPNGESSKFIMIVKENKDGTVAYVEPECVIENGVMKDRYIIKKQEVMTRDRIAVLVGEYLNGTEDRPLSFNLPG